METATLPSATYYNHPANNQAARYLNITIIYQMAKRSASKSHDPPRTPLPPITEPLQSIQLPARASKCEVCDKRNKGVMPKCSYCQWQFCHIDCASNSRCSHRRIGRQCEHRCGVDHHAISSVTESVRAQRVAMSTGDGGPAPVPAPAGGYGLRSARIRPASSVHGNRTTKTPEGAFKRPGGRSPGAHHPVRRSKTTSQPTPADFPRSMGLQNPQPISTGIPLISRTALEEIVCQ
ncbi:uncharacterized protein BDV17DRAFT_175793 [Aspergillus undulatus]|uniref:uncharacterized protein n=1 Tax=Aspergillus undulatus TaxID=1810928 RepID=UPI003CCD5FEA